MAHMKDAKQDKYIIYRKNRTAYEELMADETIFSLGNGVLGTRGHFSEGYGMHDYPQTLMDGFYDLYTYKYEENYKQFPQMGQTIVNLPDASYIKIELDDGVLDMSQAALTELERSLDMSSGMTYRKATYLTKSGYEMVIEESKIVPYHERMIVTKLRITSKNYQGKIKLSSYVRMPLSKKAHPLDPRLPHARKHLSLDEIHAHQNYAYLTAITSYSGLRMRVMMTHDMTLDYRCEADEVIGEMTYDIMPDQTIDITKHQYYYTSQDIPNFDEKMAIDLKHKKAFETYLLHEKELKTKFWKYADIEVDDQMLDQSIRYNIYQLHQSGANDEKRHIAAKGISGEGYEGHYFWDTEAYMLPFFILTHPKQAKTLLMYRYHTLDEARLEAHNLGVSRGAKIPWRTINGKESSPYYPAGSAQMHINSDIAHAIKTYYYATRDDLFMAEYGLEILLETAIFLLEYGHFNEQGFHIYGVTGPDEYTAIVNDNYYTNKMAQAHFSFTYDYVTKHYDKVHHVLEKLSISVEDLTMMKRASDEMTLLICQDKKVIKQDQSFMDKKELDIQSIPKDHFPLLLNYHPLHIYKHQVLKQADTMVALVFLNDVEKTLYQNTFDYYLKRTTHDSSLSKCIYGISAYHLGQHELAYAYFKYVATLDLEDRKKYTRYGLHAANLGGSYLMLAYGLFGIRMKEILHLDPAYQKEIKQASIHITYHQKSIHISLKGSKITLTTDGPIELMVYGKHVVVEASYTFGVKVN